MEVSGLLTCHAGIIAMCMGEVRGGYAEENTLS